jgi:hypothetical protein
VWPRWPIMGHAWQLVDRIDGLATQEVLRPFYRVMEGVVKTIRGKCHGLDTCRDLVDTCWTLWTLWTLAGSNRRQQLQLSNHNVSCHFPHFAIAALTLS